MAGVTMRPPNPAVRPQIVPVCRRCRQRKQKCDSDMSGCNPCVQSGNECRVEDPETGRTVPRVYVQRLEQHAQDLRQALDDMANTTQSRDATATASVLSQEHNTHQNSGKRYLGASSGISFIESAITLAKAYRILADSQESLPDTKIGSSPDSKQLLQILSPVPSQANLDRETVSRLFDYFLATQWMYRILTREEFDIHASRFFSTTPHTFPESAIVIHMVSAISTFYLGMAEGNVMASNLAEVQYERALHSLPSILPNRNIHTLQTILLVLLFSFLNPQKPVTWHLLGVALRLATFLGLNEEIAIAPLDHDAAKDARLRQHLFWSLYSIDRAVGNTLGRPTALQDMDVHVSLPDTGVIPEIDSSLGSNAAVVNHCIRLRKLQSEVADILYQKTRAEPAGFTTDIQRRLDMWLAEAPMSDASLQAQEWMQHSYHNLTMFIHRQSLIRPTSVNGAHQRSFKSASKVLWLYSKMHQRNAIDCTWMAFHWLFLAAVTHLFCLWTSAEIREVEDWQEINDTIQTTRMVLSAMVDRWRSGRKILDIYCQLSKGTLRRFVQLIPTTVHEQGREQEAAILRNTSEGDPQREVADGLSLPTQLVDVPFSQVSLLQFEDILMEDDLDYWLSSAPYES